MEERQRKEYLEGDGKFGLVALGNANARNVLHRVHVTLNRQQYMKRKPGDQYHRTKESSSRRLVAKGAKETKIEGRGRGGIPFH